MTQAVLSEATGVSEGYISQIECGKVKASLSRLDQISDILKVDISCLISDRGCPENGKKHSEILDIINDWPPDRIALLMDLLLCVGKHFKDSKHN